MVLSRDAKNYVSGIEIMTTRFSDYGFRENKEWREERGMTGCVWYTEDGVIKSGGRCADVYNRDE